MASAQEVSDQDAVALQQQQDTINLSNLESVPIKTTIAVLNEYFFNQIDFVNKYAQASEKSLNDLDQILYTLEAKVSLLEQKLDSVNPEFYANLPEIDTVTNYLPTTEMQQVQIDQQEKFEAQQQQFQQQQQQQQSVVQNNNIPAPPALSTLNSGPPPLSSIMNNTSIPKPPPLSSIGKTIPGIVSGPPPLSSIGLNISAAPQGPPPLGSIGQNIPQTISGPPPLGSIGQNISPPQGPPPLSGLGQNIPPPQGPPPLLNQPPQISQPAQQQQMDQTQIPEQQEQVPSEPPEELRKYIKMFKMGVHPNSIKIKMQAEGHDPDEISSYISWEGPQL